MTSTAVPLIRSRAFSRPVIVAGAVVIALLLNISITSIGRAAGGTFVFTSPTGPAFVDPITVAGFTVLPLGVALTAVALLSLKWRWVIPAAMVAGPVLELGSIVGMTLPADFDVASKVSLALCHVALVPVTLVALELLRRRSR